MNNFDHMSLDGRLLHMFVAVYETGSVTKAADGLGVTQSTVSHGLNRLRQITNDELFVPMGRSITPTGRADQLIEQARDIIGDMQKFTQAETYNPLKDTSTFVLAASDYEIEVIVKPLMRILRKQAPNAMIQVMPAYSQSEWAELLRSSEVDLVLSPELEGGESDLMQQKLLSEHEICFYNPGHQRAPETLDLYCAAPHANMALGQHKKTNIDETLLRIGRARRIVASLPSFAAVASVVQDTDIIATMPSRLQDTMFKGFNCCELPITLKDDTITATWHVRNNASLRHKWLRKLVRSCVEMDL